ncbi:MAG: hypothetical protein F4Y88_08230 [Chloroflexi bacterium]|nr:hypothetical protein [Chloroflexota bacterium]
MTTEDAYWLYKNDVGDPVPYIRIHHEWCQAADKVQRSIRLDGSFDTDRWNGPHDTYHEALNVAQRIMANVLRCKKCEWRYPNREDG